MNEGKRLMILGAGPHQVPAIRKAVDLGLFVITVDYLPENIGHKLSHQYVNCSTADPDGVLEAAKRLDVDGVMTIASDVATPAVAYVAEVLGLPGCRLAAARTMSHKAKFRQRQSERGCNHPPYLFAERMEDVRPRIGELDLPVMFKPVDTSGSRGVSRADRLDEGQLRRAFEYAQGYSRAKGVCVEEFLEGTEVGGDGFLAEGRLVFAVITHKYKRGFVVTGHSLPTNISADDQERVRAELTRNCAAVGYTDGALNFDVIVAPQRVTVLEMSPRLGGNGISMLIQHGTGVDVLAATVRFAVGEGTAWPARPGLSGSCGSWVFGSDRPGTVEEVASEQQLRAAVPEVFDCCINTRVGDRVAEFIHNGNSLGFAIFDCPVKWRYEQMVTRLERALHLKVAGMDRPERS